MESYHPQTHTVHSKSDIFYGIPPPSSSQHQYSSIQDSGFDGAVSGHRRDSLQSHPDAQPQYYAGSFQQQFDNTAPRPPYDHVSPSVDVSYQGMQQVMHGDVYHQQQLQQPPAQYYSENQLQQQQHMAPYYPHAVQADPTSYAQSHGTFSNVSSLARHVPVDGSQYSDVSTSSSTYAGHFAHNTQSAAPGVVNQQVQYYQGDMPQAYSQQYYSHSEANTGHEGQQYQQQSVEQFQPHAHHSAEPIVIQPPIYHQNQQYGYTGGSCEPAVPPNEAQTAYTEPHHPHAPSLTINTDVPPQGVGSAVSAQPSSAYTQQQEYTPYAPQSSVSAPMSSFTYDDGIAYPPPEDDEYEWSSEYPAPSVPTPADETPAHVSPVTYAPTDTQVNQVASAGSYSSSGLTRSSTMPASHEHMYSYGEQHGNEEQAVSRQNSYAGHEQAHSVSQAAAAPAQQPPLQDVKSEMQESPQQMQEHTPLPPQLSPPKSVSQLPEHSRRESRRQSHSSDEPLAPPPFLVRSSARPSSVMVAVAASLNVPVPPSDINAPTSHEARVMRRKSASLAAQHYNPYGPAKDQRDAMKSKKKVQRPSISEGPTSPSSSYPAEPSADYSPASSQATIPSPSRPKYEHPQVISIAERAPITMPPFATSSTSTEGSSAVAPQTTGTPFIAHEFNQNGGHQIIKFSSPEAESSPSGAGDKNGSGSNGKGKSAASSNGTCRNGYMDANGDKKPFLACRFCRQRKIACGPGPLAESSDPAIPVGPRTCNQCFRRGIDCEYPSESRRGLRKVHDEEENDKAEGTSTTGPSKKKKQTKPRPPIEMIRAADHDLIIEIRPPR